ncbi:MAG TPA: hypothetical protein VG797_09515 [Phycisphaerales bacterium]|nr:hypothetical protein [Phycisphaerales bacterium]
MPRNTEITSITWSQAVPYAARQGFTDVTASAGAPFKSVVSAGRSRREIELSETWSDAIESMLAWRLNADVFEETFRPAAEIIDTAIDFAWDQASRFTDAPSSIVPGGNGTLVFEWHGSVEALTIEFVEQGRARVALFTSNRIIKRGLMTRNPANRRLEMQ